MARGWESKSVESQQADALEATSQKKPPRTPEELAKAQRREGILLSRKHIREQLQTATNPRHKQMLETALAELDARLAALR
jgi:hypothetical protein